MTATADSSPAQRPAARRAAGVTLDAERVLALARATFDIEARELLSVGARQGDAFVRAVTAILACQGRTVIMGMGKSGHVGRKIAATLASTGSPAFFVHPGEACHGDLGMITAADVALSVAFTGFVSAMLTVRLPFFSESSTIGTRKFVLVCPGENVAVPTTLL